MDIKIDKLKLTDSPYSAARKDSFLFEESDSIDQIILELKHAHPSSFLVSGYRGVGKTSFVNRVAESLSKEFICVNINLAKYDGYPNLIKKLIRQLYINYEQFVQNSETDFTDLTSEFRLLYDRTFQDVVSSQILNTSKEFKISSDMEFNLKKALPILFVVFSVANIYFNILSSKALDILLFLASLLWACLTSFKFGFSRAKVDSSQNELSRKSLYDDEIAEHHLLAILQKLQTKGIKVLIAFDEIDKIQTSEESGKVINDLKSMLLSGYANFFVIAGQGLYYEYEKSVFKEDQVISTLFSKNIHISFLRYTTIKKFCLSLLEEPGAKTIGLVNDYFDTLILLSGRTPRKLVNLIRSNLRWEGSQAFISIDDTLEMHYTREAKLLATLTNIMDDDLPRIAKNEVQLDFFVAQIHLWISKMKEYTSSNFLISVIVDKKSYDGFFPSVYISQLYALEEMLTDRLLDENILKIHHEEELERESSYYWTPFVREGTIEDAEISGVQPEDIDPSEGDETTPERINSYVEPNFVSEFIELEVLFRQLCSEISPPDDLISTLSFKKLVHRLIDEGVLTRYWYDSSKIDELIDTRNKIVHGHAIGNNDLDIIRNSEFTLSRLKAEVMNDFVFHICNGFLHAKGYTIQKDNKGGFDFTASIGNQMLLFDVKSNLTGRIDQKEINQVIDKYSIFSDINVADSYYILLVFQYTSKKISNNFDMLHNVAGDQFDNLKKRVKFIYIPESPDQGLSNYIQSSLNMVITELSIQTFKPLSFFTAAEAQIANQIIKEESVKQWPDDYDMQLSVIESQASAFKKLSELRSDTLGEKLFTDLSRKAKTEWPRDYDMQYHLFQEQRAAFQKMANLNNESLPENIFKQIKERSVKSWPDDFVMQIQEFEREKEAFLALQNFQAEIDENVLEQIKEKAKNEWPKDYGMQLNTIKTQVESFRKLS